MGNEFYIPCRHYHAQLSQNEREQTQYNWTRGIIQIIVATVAFGMGELCLENRNVPLQRTSVSMHSPC